MCLAIPGKIIKTNDQLAAVDFDGIIKDVNVSLVKAKKGDYVVVHAGFAIEKVEKEMVSSIKSYVKSK